jgi:lysophospholipase L1-like esterase
MLLERARTGDPSPVIFIGDSITQGWELEGGKLWAERFAPLKAINLGASGDRTEHVLWRLKEAPLGRLDPSVVVILIGTNNVGHGRDDAAATLAGVNAVVECVRAQVPKASIVLCSIFPRGAQMNAMRGQVLQVNQALARTYPSEGGGGGVRRGVQVLDLGTRFIDPDGSIPASLMPDGLHLSPAGYAVWAEALRPFMPMAPQTAPSAAPSIGP